MNQYCPECDWQLEIAKRMVRKDKRQRWVYFDQQMKTYRISDKPLPHLDKISVYWMPLVGRSGAIGYTYSPRLATGLGHCAF